MHRGYPIMVLILILLLVPTVAFAGGAGNMKLARAVDRVALGQVTIYLQALQHNQHALADAEINVSAKAPDGSTVLTQGVLDPSYGKDHVFVVTLPLAQTGSWQVEITAKHWVIFPPLVVSVDVQPKGTILPDPGPVRPFDSVTSGYSIVQVNPQPQQALTTPPVNYIPAPVTAAEVVDEAEHSDSRWLVTLAALIALPTIGWMIWRGIGPGGISLQ